MRAGARSWHGCSGQAEAAPRVEIGGSLRGRRAGIDAEECTVVPRSRLCRSGRRSCRTEMGAPGGCPREPVRAGVGHGRAGRGLSEPLLGGGWAGAGALEWLHAAHVDVTSRQGALPPHATRDLDSAPPAGGSRPQIRPPTPVVPSCGQRSPSRGLQAADQAAHHPREGLASLPWHCCWQGWR